MRPNFKSDIIVCVTIFVRVAESFFIAVRVRSANVETRPIGKEEGRETSRKTKKQNIRGKVAFEKKPKNCLPETPCTAGSTIYIRG